mgnify:FL=1
MPKSHRAGRALSAARSTKSVSKVSDVFKLPDESEKSAKDENVPQDEGKSGENSVGKLSRGQLKRKERREKFLKRLEAVDNSLRLSSNNSKNSSDRKKSVFDVRHFDDAFTDGKGAKADSAKLEVEESKQLKQLTNEKKKKVAIRELEQMKLVMEHPQFVANPFATMMDHLNNTLAPGKQQPKLVTGKKKNSLSKKRRAEQQPKQNKEKRFGVGKKRKR